MTETLMPNSAEILPAGSLVQSLADTLGPRGLLTGDQISEAYTRDWANDRTGQYLAVVRPRSTTDVSRVCRLCTVAGIGIVPQGGHTGLVGGAQRQDGDCILLSTQRMNAIEEVDPDNMTCTVEAGVVLENLQSVLAEQDLQFGVSIGSQGTAQIGGLVSTNAGGVQVVRHGMTASNVLGLELVLADGRVVSSISGLHKDNRGPDPLRIAIGGEGAFGVVTKVCLRLSVRQRRFATAYAGCSSFADALALLKHLRRECHEVLSVFEVMSEACMPLAQSVNPNLKPPLAAPVHVLIQLSSAMDLPLEDLIVDQLATAMDQRLVLDAAIAQSYEQARRFWSIREGLVEGHSRRGFHVRSDVSLRLGSVPQAVLELEAMLAREFPGWISQSYGHLGDGNLHFNALPPEGMAEVEARSIGQFIEARIFSIVLDLEGSFSAEHGIGRSKATWFQKALPDRHELLRRYKSVLDPNGIMNPGCMVSIKEVAD